MLRQAAQGDGRIPERIKNAPELYQGLGIFLTAFNDLMTSRNSTGMIPWVVMRDWAQAHNPGDEEFMEDVMHFIHEMDIAYLKYKEKKKPLANDKPKPETKKRMIGGR